MEKEEAIKVLTNLSDQYDCLRDYIDGNYGHKEKQALDLAIDTLNETQNERHLPDYTYEAEMAQRLKQQTNADAISRDEAVEAIRKAETKECAEWSVKGLPTVDPPVKCIAQIKVDTDELIERIKENYVIFDAKWTPCSEGLPDVDPRAMLSEEVLGTDKNGYLRHVILDCSRRYSKPQFVTVEEAMAVDIIAWMPLPDPFEKGDDK